MATQKLHPQDLEAARASVDLSDHQYRLVKLTDAGELAPADAGDIGFSLQDKPKEGQYGTYAAAGSPKAEAGGTIDAGEPVSVGANSKLVAATAAVSEGGNVKSLGSRVIGVALESGVDGDVISYRHEAGGRA